MPRHEELLRDILWEESGFDGYVMTDWNGYGDEPSYLPHDYMILTERSEDAPGGFGLGYYKTSEMEYFKVFEAPAEWAGKKVIYIWFFSSTVTKKREFT